jgi:hypothetical protein
MPVSDGTFGCQSAFILAVAILTLLSSASISSASNSSDDVGQLHAVGNGSAQQSNLIFPEPGEYKTSWYNDVLYTYHYNTYREWNDAFWFCRDTGGELASILSKSQQNVIQGLLKKPRNTEEYNLVWLGGTSWGDCVWRWKWPDVYQPVIHEIGHDINHDYLYVNWDNNEPSLESIGISNDPFNVFGKWKTHDRYQQHAFICQFDRCQRLSHTSQCLRTRFCAVDENTGGCRRTKRPINFVAPTANI